MEKKELELYIHIPFCVRKCNYCDFLSFPADEDTQKLLSSFWLKVARTDEDGNTTR